MAMTKIFARLEGGQVVERLEAQVLPPFHPSLVWVECPSEAVVGWLFADGEFSPATISEHKLSIIERAWRDAELVELVWLRDRHRDQLEIGVTTTLTSEQFSELLVFMQALRDWPQSEAFPDTSARPVPPAFLEQMRIDQ